jgi:hypothetical protein
MWTKVETGRYNRTDEGYITACVYPFEDGYRAWAWPLKAGAKSVLGTFISASRAKEACDAALQVD